MGYKKVFFKIMVDDIDRDTHTYSVPLGYTAPTQALRKTPSKKTGSSV